MLSLHISILSQNTTNVKNKAGVFPCGEGSIALVNIIDMIEERERLGG
jgi:hypothetical protein